MISNMINLDLNHLLVLYGNLILMGRIL